MDTLYGVFGGFIKSLPFKEGTHLLMDNASIHMFICPYSPDHTGRGEMSVPTKSIQTKVERVHSRVTPIC